MQVILPTCLRGYVAAVHLAILTCVFALQRLGGQVVSEFEAKRLGVLPGSRLLARRNLSSVHKDLIRGLVMLEGSLPACHLNPLLHRWLHYAPQTAQKGILEWMAMWGFERYNRKIKNLVRNSSAPLSTITHNIQMDIHWSKVLSICE